jgi:hypothetical protein
MAKVSGYIFWKPKSPGCERGRGFWTLRGLRELLFVALA